jgi:hypothetical protein
MQMEFAIFCDAAEITAGGLIYMLRGGYDLVASTGFPATLNRQVLVIRLICEPIEINCDQILVAQIIDPIGHVLPLEMRVPFKTPPYPGEPSRRNRMTLKLDYLTLEFPEPGEYLFRFLVDGNQVGEARLDVKRKEGTA